MKIRYFYKLIDAYISLCLLLIWFISASCLNGPKSESFHPNLAPWESYWQMVRPNPNSTSCFFFLHQLHCTGQFRARLDHPAPTPYRPSGSLHPTSGAASGLCHRFRFTSHSQFLISGVACQPPFADSAANPREKSGAPFPLVRVNVLSGAVPLGQWMIDFRQTRPGLAEIKYSFLLCFLLIVWNGTTALGKEKVITYSMFIGLIVKFQCTHFIAFLILFVKSKHTIIKQKTICIPRRIRNSKITYRMQEMDILATVCRLYK